MFRLGLELAPRPVAAHSPEAAVASLFLPGDLGFLLTSDDATSLLANRDGTGGGAGTGAPVGAWIDKRYMGGVPVADYLAANGLSTALAAPGLHLVAASDNARPLRTAYGLSPDGVDDRMNAALGHTGGDLYLAARLKVDRQSGSFSRIAFAAGNAATAALGDGDARVSITPAGGSLLLVTQRGTSNLFDGGGTDGEDAVVEAIFGPTQQQLVVNGRTSTKAIAPALGGFTGDRIGLFGDIRDTLSPNTGLCTIAPVKRAMALSRIPTASERAAITTWLAA